MTTYTKISDFCTIITEKVNASRINVFTVYQDGENTIITEKMTFATENAAQDEVIRRVAKLA